MDRRYGTDRFWTTSESHPREGSSTLRLHREGPGGTAVAAEVVFWDAAGQFFLETLKGDVPLTIIEALIAEANDTIKTK